MSKNIVIQEGGSARQLTVEKLRTRLADGGSCLWVPEQSVRLGRKTITENGTYLAAEDELYGYSQVTVRGIGRATGRDDDGNDYEVTSDDTGALRRTKLASSIRVTTLPNVTSYSPGETIDYTGLVVTAYDANGSSMGRVSNGALILPVTVATGGTADVRYESADGTVKAMALQYLEAIYDATQSIWYYPVPLGTHGGLNMTIGGTIGHTAGEATVLATRYNGTVYLARIDGNVGECKADLVVWETDRLAMYGHAAGGVPYNAFARAAFSEDMTYPFPETTVNPADVSPSDLNVAQGTLALPVRWNRAGDGKMLETEFEIEVRS